MSTNEQRLRTNAARFSPASRAAALALPGRLVASSTRVGWTSLLLEVRAWEGADASAEVEAESPPTPDQTLAVLLGGEVRLAALRNGVWRPAVRQAGSAGLTPGGGADDRRDPGPLTDRRLARVVEYMSAHFAEPLGLERLAAEAGVSRFHFARLFRGATGESPHAYLVRLRMNAARQLLRDTALTAAEVAAATGYAGAAHFTRAFARHVGRTPTAFRAAARGEPGRTARR